MQTGPLLYLNYNQATSGSVARTALPRDYVLACRFVHCGIIDRTRTLETGFDYAVLDEIPMPVDQGASFAELCDARGVEIVAEACRTDRPIDVLWSGGIDSTTALIAIMKAAGEQRAHDRVRVLLSMDSVLENPGFYLSTIRSGFQTRSISHPVSAFLDPGRITVTGEHGDQLFGSRLLESYVRRDLACAPYRDILPLVMLERLGNPLSAYRALRFLEPVLEAAPVPLHTLFDVMWWLNFSVKWQEVTMRLAAFRRSQARPVYESLRHFFRSETFQSWALANPQIRDVPVWSRYKDEAKQYILDFTGDQHYYLHKEKEDSLRNVMASRANPERYRIVMRDDFRPVIEAVQLEPERGLRHALDTVRGLPARLTGVTNAPS
jgi:hypothetical protein